MIVPVTGFDFGLHTPPRADRQWASSDRASTHCVYSHSERQIAFGLTKVKPLGSIGPICEMSWESINEPLQSIANPGWDEVEARLKRLETVESGSVFLKAKNGTTLSIGSDQGKGYLVFITEGEKYRYLQAPLAKRKGLVSLVIGFQPAEYPCRIIVARDASLKAARAYFDTGRVGNGEEWTVDAKTVE